MPQDQIEAQQIKIFEQQYEQQKQDTVVKDLRRSASNMWRGNISLSLQVHHLNTTVQDLQSQLAGAKNATTAAETR